MERSPEGKNGGNPRGWKGWKRCCRVAEYAQARTGIGEGIITISFPRLPTLPMVSKYEVSSMTCSDAAAGRVQFEVSDYGRDDFWTFDAVQERLVEAVRLWWRSPGEGRWPFASDAPWHLMTRRTRIEAGDFRGRELQLRMQAEDAEEAKRWEGRDRSGPLTRDDVARRDEATDWLGHVPARDRKLVILALLQFAGGRLHIDWSRVKRELGAEIGNKGVYRRYHRAISAIAMRLNAQN